MNSRLKSQLAIGSASLVLLAVGAFADGAVGTLLPATSAPVVAPDKVTVTSDNFIRLRAEAINPGQVVIASFDVKGRDFAWHQWETGQNAPDDFAKKLSPEQYTELLNLLDLAHMPTMLGRYTADPKAVVGTHTLRLQLKGAGPRPDRYLVTAQDGAGPAAWVSLQHDLDQWLKGVVPAASYTHWYF